MPTITTKVKIIGVKEAAQILGVSPYTIRQYADKGTLESFRLPNGARRFLEPEVRKLKRYNDGKRG